MARLQHPFKEGPSLTTDQSILWIKEGLRILTDWTQGQRVLQPALSKLLGISSSKLPSDPYPPYWHKTCKTARSHLLALKYQVENPRHSNQTLIHTCWQHALAAFDWVITPMLKQFELYQNQFHPLQQLPATIDHRFNPLLTNWHRSLEDKQQTHSPSAAIPSPNFVALLLWLHQHQAEPREICEFFEITRWLGDRGYEQVSQNPAEKETLHWYYIALLTQVSADNKATNKTLVQCLYKAWREAPILAIYLIVHQSHPTITPNSNSPLTPLWQFIVENLQQSTCFTLFGEAHEPLTQAVCEIYQVHSNQSDTHQGCDDKTRADWIAFVKALWPKATLLHHTLLNIPNTAGFRYSEYEAYQTLLKAITALQQPAQPTFQTEDANPLAKYTTQANHNPSSSPPATLTFTSPHTQQPITVELHGDVTALILNEHGDLKHWAPNEAPTTTSRWFFNRSKAAKHTNSIKSQHTVARLRHRGFDLHIKAAPDFPAMDYAVDLFNRRFVGHGSMANTLGVLTLHEKSTQIKRYPVLISTTAQGKNLKTVLMEPKKVQACLTHFNEEALAELFMLECLKYPGDGFSRNYVVGQPPQTNTNPRATIHCIDNDQMFVVPIKPSGLLNRNTLQVRSILFCLPQFVEMPIPNIVLKRFTQLNVNKILKAWLEDAAAQVKRYLLLFNKEERKHLFEQDQQQRHTPRLLLRQGLIAELAMQMRYTQQLAKVWLIDEHVHTARELSYYLNEHVAACYDKARHPQRSPERMFEAATNATESRTSSQALTASGLGHLRTDKEIQDATELTPEEALKEIKLMEFHLTETFTKEGFTPDGYDKTRPAHVTVEFKPLPSDETQQEAELTRQRAIIKLLIVSQCAFHTLNLTKCIVLDDTQLSQLLSNSQSTLVELTLNGCPQITETSARSLANYFSNLQHLSLSRTGIINFCSFVARGSLNFPSLETCHLADCTRAEYNKGQNERKPSLTQVNLEAPQLIELKLNDNPALQTVQVNAPQLTQLILKGATALHTLTLQQQPALVTLDLRACPQLPEENFNWHGDSLQALKLAGCQQFAHSTFRANYPTFFSALKWHLYSDTFVNRLNTHLHSLLNTHNTIWAACPQALKQALAQSLAAWGKMQTIIPALLQTLRNKDNESWTKENICTALGNSTGHLKPFINTVIPALLHASQDNNSNVQTAAITALGNSTEHLKPFINEVISALLNALKDNNLRFYVRTATITALGNMTKHHPQLIIPVLLQASQDNDSDVRKTVIITLEHCAEHLKPFINEVIPALLQAASSKDIYYSDVRTTAITALGNVAKHHPQQIIPILLQASQDNDSDVRKTAIITLGHCAEHLKPFINEVIPALLQAASSKDIYYFNVRTTAITALGNVVKHHPQQAIPILLQGSQDNDSDVRTAAITALGNSTKDLKPFINEVIPTLLHASSKDNFSDIRIAAITALGNSTKDDLKPFINKVIPVLLHASQDNYYSDVRTAAITTLGKVAKHQPQQIIPILLQASQNNDSNVRTATITALGNSTKDDLKPFINKVIPVLLHASQDNDPDVRKTAITALGNSTKDLKPFINKVIPTLLQASSKDNYYSDDRTTAITALGNVAKHHPQQIIPILLHTSQDSDSNIRTTAITALGNSTEHLKPFINEVTSALLHASQDNDSNVRTATITALGNMTKHHPQQIIPILLHSSQDNDSNVRTTAIIALGNSTEYLKPFINEAISVLLQAASSKNIYYSDVRTTTAITALRNMAKHHPQQIIPILLHASQDNDSNIRTTAISALGNSTEYLSPFIDEVISTLLHASSESNISDIRTAAIIALGHCAKHLKPFINEVIPVLLQAASSEYIYYSDVQTAAITTLKLCTEHHQQQTIPCYIRGLE